MRFLIIPGNNSLSHGIKSLAIQSSLISRGHECLIAVSQARAEFYKTLDVGHAILGDIQEIDGSAYPTINWFRDPQVINECIANEMALIRNYKPDRILGVFRFTLKASSSLCGLPYESLISGCMLPDIPDALGFNDDAHERGAQREFINMFFRSAGKKISKSLSVFGLEAVSDIREMLIGNRTYLWDIPEFMPIPEKEDVYHVGPIFWNEWIDNPVDMNYISEGSKPIAVLAFGTCNGNAYLYNRMINILCDLGYKVIVAAGGQEGLVSLLKRDMRVCTYLFAPVEKILPHASVVVCHGGQMTIFEALTHEVPVIVIPFHPEQAHNGICLKRIGCGRMLVPARRFVGNSSVYTDMLDEIGDEKIKSIIIELVEDPDTKENLKKFKNILTRYNGLETLTNRLGQ